jgi:hypothetical protein
MAPNFPMCVYREAYVTFGAETRGDCQRGLIVRLEGCAPFFLGPGLFSLDAPFFGGKLF